MEGAARLSGRSGGGGVIVSPPQRWRLGCAAVRRQAPFGPVWSVRAEPGLPEYAGELERTLVRRVGREGAVVRVWLGRKGSMHHEGIEIASRSRVGVSLDPGRSVPF